MTQNKSVIVIGSGLGGLSACVSLASKGFKVTLLEKNAHLGGKLNRHQQEGFSFDMGPSIFTLPDTFRDVFKQAGESFDQLVELVKVRPFWRNFFEDKTILDLDPDDQKMKNQLDKLHPNAYNEYLNFKRYSRQQHDLVKEGYFDKGLDNLWEMIRYYGLWKLFFKLDSTTTMQKAIEKRVSEPHLQDVFSFFIKYVGSSAVNANGFMNMMPDIHWKNDLYYLKGGMFTLSQAYEKVLRKLKVDIRLNTEVTQLQSSNGKITGVVTLSGEQLTSDFVVSNMEVIPVYERLLHEDQQFMATLKKFEPSCSGLVLHLATDKVYPQLAHHNFFFASNQKKHYSDVYDKGLIPTDPTLYVVAPGRSDASVAPAGCDNIKVLPHIPYLREDRPVTDHDYHLLKERIIDKLVRMGLTDLREHIKFEHVWTPKDIFANYYSNGGSIYGVVTDKQKNNGFKAPKRSQKYRNLYFVGGSVNPGGGMPMVTLSGYHVANFIQNDAEKQ